MINKFSEIFLKSKTVSDRALKGYKIYTDKDNFQVIEAATVSEAIEKSGIKAPFKIVPAGIVTKSVFTQSEISEKQAAQISTTDPVNPA
jgi:putative ubiquitin-RnfH superfamily antitoxin RatB of RatAB toxin-antitoxin module